MTRLAWGLLGDRSYQFGVDRGVLYPKNSAGVVWDGLISVSESSSDTNQIGHYIEGIRYFTQISFEDFGVALVAYTYPDEVEESIFDLCYRTQTDEGYKIHLVYNVHAEIQAMDYSTVNRSTDAINFGWDMTTIPERIPGFKSSAHLIIDSRFAYGSALDAIEDVLYGSDDNDPYLPSAADVMELFNGFAVLKITDNGDGTWTADGPDDVVYFTDSETFEIDYSSVVYLDEITYQVSSL